MADLTYSVDVKTRDAVSAINGLKTAIAGLASAFSIQQFVAFNDQVTSLKNRLLTLNPSLDYANKQFNALAAIAIEARTPLAATADLYYRIARSADALGISQKEAAQITESVAKALTASGQSAAEASGPLLQLGQALQSGTFQGDELRSILEGLPPVAKALADELGVPVGSLKKLGSEGQISADVFVKAMRRAKDSIDEAFGRTTPTISQALTNLKTNASIVFNEFEKNTGTGKTLANTIEYIGFQIFKLSKNIDAIAGPLMTFIKFAAAIAAFTIAGRILRAVVVAIDGVALSWGMLRASFSNAFDLIKNFGAAVAAVGKNFEGIYGVVRAIIKPFASFVGLLISGAAAVGAYLGIDKLIDDIKSIGDTQSSAGEDMKAYREELAKMKQGLDDTAGPSENAAQKAKELANAMAKARLEMREQTGNLERSLTQTRERLALENEFLAANKDRITISQDEIEIGKQATDIDIDRRNAIADINNQMAKLQLEYSQLVKKDSDRGKEISGQLGILGEQKKRVNELYDQHTSGMTNLLRSNQTLKLLEEDRKRTQENITKQLEEQYNQQQKLNGILADAGQKLLEVRDRVPESQRVGLSGIQKQILDIQEKTRKAAQDAARSFAEGFGEIETPEQANAFAAGLDQIAAAYKLVADAEIQYAQQSNDVQRKWSTGWEDAFTKYIDDAFNAANAAQTYFERFSRGFEDAFVAMLTKGKFSFKDFTNNLIADFARIEARKMFSTLFGGAGKTEGGSVLMKAFTWGKSLFGMANGGSVMGQNPVVVGERGPELFIPSSAGKIIPNNQLQPMMPEQKPITVNYNINAVDASSFRALVARDPSFIYAVTEQGRRSQPTRNR